VAPPHGGRDERGLRQRAGPVWLHMLRGMALAGGTIRSPRSTRPTSRATTTGRPARVEPLELPEPARDPDREQPTEEPAAPTEEPVPA
jgi:hypothetical protein